MNYSGIKYNDISNGPGVRTSLFVSGCTHHCYNCFNQMTWDFNYGEPFDEKIQNEILESFSPFITGLTLLGGEPMEPANQKALLPFLREYKSRYPKKSLWIYSGYTYEQLTGEVPFRCRCEDTDEILSMMDVLVDGRYVDELHDISLRFRGSSNQRLIDVKASVANGKIIYWQDEPLFAKHEL